jgi:acyl carrier protein
MADVSEIQDSVRAYIVESFLTDADAAEFRDDDDLLALLDSLEILRTIVALEASFSIKVFDGELSVENLGSVEKMAAFLALKVQSRLEPQVNHAAG